MDSYRLLPQSVRICYAKSMRHSKYCRHAGHPLSCSHGEYIPIHLRYEVYLGEGCEIGLGMEQNRVR
jgi:hypothetical protein